MRVFVTGASGFIGSAVVRSLIGAGHHVTGLARSDAGAGWLAGLGADVHHADLTDLNSLGAAAAAVDGVIHLAFRHGDAVADAVGTDRLVIEAVGAALSGSDRPFVVTSGTLVLPADRLVTEADTTNSSAPAGARGTNERVALALAGRGVRVSVVRLAPSVHERVRRGFVGSLVDAAQRSGVSGYLGDGSQRWPAVHRQDAASLFRLTLEQAPAGSVVHGVGEQGVQLRAIAEVIGERLGLPAQPVPAGEAEAHFGWLAPLVGTDAPASSAATRRLLDWEPTHLGLLDDLATGDFFQPAPQ